MQLRMSRIRGSRTSAYVKVSRFQDLCFCQGFEVPGPLCMPRFTMFQDLCCVRQGFEVPGPLCMPRCFEVPGPVLCVCQGFMLRACQGFEVPGSLCMSMCRGSRTSAYVKVVRFQDLCVCQGFEVPGPLRTSMFRGSRTCLKRLEVPGPLPMSRFQVSRTSAYVTVSRFQLPRCVCQCVEVPGPLRTLVEVRGPLICI
jgi:hypothetical protein